MKQIMKAVAVGLGKDLLFLSRLLTTATVVGCGLGLGMWISYWWLTL